MAKSKKHDDEKLQPQDPELYLQLESQVRKVNFLNTQIIVVQEERHLSSQMEVDFSTEDVTPIFDDMKKISKIPLLEFLDEQITQATNIFKNLTLKLGAS
jgi:hypothetical protein